MSYLSLYRKYRPRLFSDFTGQAHIIKTLENAISKERIAHAYLFAGPRGTGKTSAAKVLAKAVNCEEGFASPEPCNRCSNCQRIEKGNSLEIIEIDAASNRGIDEIRQLKNNVRFYPTEGRYKVYIIDEVHMLTTEAFNALLKTLEEPPAYIIFILATTEPHRLLPTILSRCQRFDFKYLTTREIKDRLSLVIEKENLSLEEGALSLIARSAEGGMRDALSLLDQVLAYGVDGINVETLSIMLGIIRQDIFVKLTEGIIAGDTRKGLSIINSLLEEGRDVEQIIKGLIYHFRNLLLVKECGRDDAIIDLPSEEMNQLEGLSSKIEGERLLKMVRLLSQAQMELRFTHHSGFILERTLVQLTKLEEEGDLRKRLHKLEKMLQEERVESPSKETQSIEKSIERKPLSRGTKRMEGRKKAPEPQADASLLGGDWASLMKYFHDDNKSIHAWLLDCQPVKTGEKTLLLEFQHKFHWKCIHEKKDLIEKVLKQVSGQDYVIQVHLKDSNGKKEKEKKDAIPPISPTEDPRIKRVMEAFQGKIIRIEEE